MLALSHLTNPSFTSAERLNAILMDLIKLSLTGRSQSLNLKLVLEPLL